MKFFNRFEVMKFFNRIAGWYYFAMGMLASTLLAAGNTYQVWEGEVKQGLDALDTAIVVSIIVGVVVVAIGFVIGAIRYMKDDMQGGKDVIVKCLVAAAVVVMAPTIVKFIVGAFAGSISTNIQK